MPYICYCLMLQIYKGFRQMQDKTQKISPIKQRILQFVDNSGLSKREFYAKTSISRGTLENPSGITEDIIARFIATFPNISPSWLLSGVGEMELSNSIVVNSTDLPPGPCLQCELREEIINEKNEVIGLLKDKIRMLNDQLKDTGHDVRQTG